ncbi:MAG: PIG-L family deacetylase [Solirubrobacteraceae bacterium]|nr:PIG-L family deacetylase [Solirubrobacteraceae bacterium]
MSWRDRSVLVVIGHPDDETLGCGGTLAKLAEEGARVTVLLPCRRTDPRGVEHWDDLLAALHGACARLGAVVALPEPMLLEPEPAVADVYDVILPHVDEHDVVLTHWHGDVHQAHRALAHAVEIATRPFRRHREVWLFDTPTSTEQAFVQTYSPNTYVVLEERHCDAAVEAMALYPVEHDIGRRPEDLRRRIEARGAEIGRTHAEGFVAVRQYR